LIAATLDAAMVVFVVSERALGEHQFNIRTGKGMQHLLAVATGLVYETERHFALVASTKKQE
jgi:hypothetical protein